MTGNIPPEIGNLQNLKGLYLGNNQLTGNIPPEIGNLKNLSYLELFNNQLTGNIPPGIGDLLNLRYLDLHTNRLTGPIPSEIGNLLNLKDLDLHANQLTGPIPSEIGILHNLRFLHLNLNTLTGPIPDNLGQLNRLERMQLSFNQLTGNIPEAFGNLVSLKSLGLTENTSMSGAIPQTLTRLNLEDLLLGGTQLCAPEDPGFQDWLRGVVNSRVTRCMPNLGRSTAYLTQATQSLEFPVPLVAGDDALLRVFITSKVDATMPPVRATFYDGTSEVYVADIPGHGSSIPLRIDEGDLTASANARVPGSVVIPGLEMVIEVDPDSTLDPALGITGRLPLVGRLPVDVRDMPPLELTVVPFLWTENPDRSILTQTEGLTAESDLFRLTRDILPVGDFSVYDHDPVWISVDPVFENRNEVFKALRVTRTMDAVDGHYMGVLRDGGGAASLGGNSMVSVLGGQTIAHELGHNMNLDHAPCGSALRPDPYFPYPRGVIGAWGYDLLNEMLVSPETKDLMSYCGPKWISDYHFSKAMGYRTSQATTMVSAYAASTRSLLLWGGVNINGELVLEPAFVVDAQPSLPQLDGPYRIIGEDHAGRTLFDLSFGMSEIADGEGESFAFILPVQPDWATRLQSITLSGPEGVSSLDGEDDPSAALLLDPATGKLRGLLHDWPEPGESEASARSVLPEPGIEIVISRGMPEAADWDR